MKPLLLLLLFSIVNKACRSVEKPAAKTFIEGTFTLQAESEFSKAMDTLVITPYNLKTGSYLITRNTGFKRIKDGKPGKWEHSSEKLIALWDEKHHQLKEMKRGIVYTPNPNGNEILVETVSYRKIKD